MIWHLSGVQGIDISGVFWRMLAPRWSFDPLSGAGAARVGGRWNAEGQPALYLSDSHGTAIAEYYQDLPRPGTLTGYDVEARGMLDIANPAVRATIGLDEDLLRRSWKRDRDINRVQPPSWDFALEAADSGFNGLRVPSVQTRGHNLVLWQWNAPDAPAVRVIDPVRDLAKNQTSWLS